MGSTAVNSKKENSSVDDISGKTFEKKVVLRLLPYLRNHGAIMAFCIFLVFLSAGVSLYAPKLLGKIIDDALLPKNQQLLFQLCALYGGLEILKLIAIFTQSFYLQTIGQRVMENIRTDLFHKLVRMPVPFFDKNPVGKLVTRVTNDTVNLSELFSSGFVMLLSDILLIVGVIGAMLMLHWKLGLLAISVFPLMILTMVVFSGRLRLAFRDSRDVLSKLNGFFAERVAGMPVVQLMQREDFERSSYFSLSTQYREKQFMGVHLYSLFHPIITILGGVTVAIVLWFGPFYMGQNEIALGTFVAFLAYAQVLYQPVRNITDRYNIFLAAMSSAERIFTLMDMDEEKDLAQEGKKSLPDWQELRFEEVSFRYPAIQSTNTVEALRKVSFTLKRGESLAIVGHTGAGKSTIISLLFRFYEPSEGRIYLGTHNLNTLPKTTLRTKIGFVPQEVFLFSGSIRDNLTLIASKSGMECGDKEILDACAHTGFDRILSRLPQGLDTYLEEKGSNLSLGERQILAFTRVYLQKPEILILDEATSSVDRESEILLQSASKNLMKDRSSIIIAHRLETVKSADKILVLQKGKLIEEGNHQSLSLQEGGVYQRFILEQARSGAVKSH